MVEKGSLPRIGNNAQLKDNTRNNNANSGLANSSLSGDGDDEYEQDFEKEDKSNHKKASGNNRLIKVRKIEPSNVNEGSSSLPMLSQRSKQEDMSPQP